MARQKSNHAPKKARAHRGNRAQRAKTSEYFVQPGKRGTVVVLRKPCGNRATPKVCGVMPSRVHAKMLVAQLEKAESVVSDLFLEATDDGIEALEAVLAACRDEVLKKVPGGNRRGGRAFDREVPMDLGDDAQELQEPSRRASGE